MAKNRKSDEDLNDMSLNIKLIKRWFDEVWNARRIETIDELLSPNFIGHYEHEEILGSQQWREQFFDPMIQAIPDFRVEILDMVADGNTVVTRWQAKGVLSGELFGVTPSNETFEFSGVSWVKIADGKIVENWNNWNMSYLFRQIQSELQTLRGIIPICASCKKIRDDEGYWNQVDAYIEKYSEAKFSHGICEKCAKDLYGNSKWYRKRYEGKE